MESSITNETIIEYEHCDIFPNRIFIKEVFLAQIMEENKSLQTQSNAIWNEKEKTKSHL